MDGISAVINISGKKDDFARQIIFYPVLSWITDALRARSITDITVISEDDENFGTLGTFEAAKRFCTEKSGSVLVLSVPVVTIGGVLDRLIAEHELSFDPVSVQGEAVFLARACDIARAEDIRSLAASAVNEGDDFLAVTSALAEYRVSEFVRDRINLALLEKEVRIIDVATTYIGPNVQIEPDAVILPNTILKGSTTVGAGAIIGPNCLLEDAHIGRATRVNASQIYSSTIGERAHIGPFAYIRPGSEVGSGVKVGDFVELKKAKIGDGTKISHLTYVGDAIVGRDCNFGCGTVTVNYDGAKKTLTRIGDHAFIGCKANLVAPVTVGDDAYIAAGSTITDDVPEKTLAIARARQVIKHGWHDRRADKK